MAHEAGFLIDVRAGGSLTIRATAPSDADQGDVFERGGIGLFVDVGTQGYFSDIKISK